jgi:hypothetical protein
MALWIRVPYITDLTKITVKVKEIAIGFSITELTIITRGGLKRSLGSR